MARKKALLDLLSNKNTLNHRLPDGDWEIYAMAIAKIMTADISRIKKTVRLQKVFRYIHDEEVVPLEGFKDRVISYVEDCDKKGLVKDRNYFIALINKWEERNDKLCSKCNDTGIDKHLAATDTGLGDVSGYCDCPKGDLLMKQGEDNDN